MIIQITKIIRRTQVKPQSEQEFSETFLDPKRLSVTFSDLKRPQETSQDLEQWLLRL